MNDIRTGADRTGKIPISIPLLSPLLLSLGIGLMLGACDMTESDGLLNPTLSDSTQVRVLNLTGETISSVSIGGIEIGTAIPPQEITSGTTVWFPGRVNMVITTSVGRDTIREQQLATASDDPLLTTFAIVPSGDSSRVIQLISSLSETENLKASGDARVYFINGVEGRTVYLREGCRSGEVLFSPTLGANLAGARDRTAGEYSLYLFEELDELASARMSVADGDITGLVATPDGTGGVRLSSFDLTVGSGGSAATLAPLAPEERTTGSVTLINALQNDRIDVEMIGTGESIVTDLPPGTVSGTTTVAVCQTADGDTIRIRTDGGDTALVPFRGIVGETSRLIVYEDGTGIGTIALEPWDGPTDNRVRVRAVNLASTDTAFSLVIGAGAPGSLSRGELLFSTLPGGRLSRFQTIDAGLYPLALEYSTSGFFVDGGLQHLESGIYTILVLATENGPEVRILAEQEGSLTMEDFDLRGTRSILFSGNPGSPVDFRIETSIGNLVVDSVAYSYVYPTVIPDENVTVSAGGESRVVDIGVAGSIFGWTGRAGQNGEIISFDRLDSRPDPGQAILRFLNAVPGSSPFSIRSDSSKGPVIATVSWPTPSEPIRQDARRFTFIVTPEGTNDELARVTAVQLSQERSYILLVVPAGATSTSGREYATMFIQE